MGTTRSEIRQELRAMPERDRLLWLVRRLDRYTWQELAQAVREHASKGYVPDWDEPTLKTLHSELEEAKEVELRGTRHGYNVWASTAKAPDNPNWFEDFQAELKAKRDADPVQRLF